MPTRYHAVGWAVTVAVVVAVPWLVRPVAAQSTDEDDSEPSVPQLRLSSAFGARVVPVGLTLGNDFGARWPLADSESKLLEDTWIEPGVTTEITPSNGWFGVYVEAVPVAVLKLRASMQSIHYFGTYGYLHVPAGPGPPDWTLDAIPTEFDKGVASRGWMATTEFRPRIKVGSFVAFVKTQFRWIDMEVRRAYYESTFDMLLEPQDGYGQVVPTAGWVFEFEGADSWLLTGVAWEHSWTFRTDLRRHMARVMGLWSMPFEIAGAHPQLALLGGHWVTHPTRGGTWYLAGQFSVDWTL